MKFENKLNKKELEKALVNWVFGTDGQDGATRKVRAVIPWTNEMEKVTMWCDKIDLAIGIRGDWDVYLLLNDEQYSNNFNKFIQTKVERITVVYDKIIRELNEKNNPKEKMVEISVPLLMKIKNGTQEDVSVLIKEIISEIISEINSLRCDS